MGTKVIDPPGTGGVVTLQNAGVSIDAVDRPGANNAGVTPCGSAGSATNEGRDVSKRSVRALGVFNILAPFGEKARDVHVVAGSTDKNLRVTHPAEALVALRTIRRHCEEVTTLPPGDVLVELIHKRV